MPDAVGKVSIAKVLPAGITDPSIKWTASNGYVQLAVIPGGTDVSGQSFIQTYGSKTSVSGEGGFARRR